MVFKCMLVCATAVGVFLLSFSTLNHFSSYHNVAKREKPFVGFSLEPSRATIAVDFANGTVWTDEVDGGAAYLEVVERLSLESSKHLAPPYREFGTNLSDLGRVMLRRIRKMVGLPASADVGALSTVISALCKSAEEKLSLRVSAASLTLPVLPAIYQDDVHDILQYVGVKYLHYGDIVRDLLYEPITAYHGYGFGQCEHWQDEERCRDELKGYPIREAITIHYAPNALLITGSSLAVASERTYRHSDFTLGSDLAHHADGTVNESYWQTLDRVIEKRITDINIRPYEVLMFVGKSAPQTIDDRFTRLVLEKIMQQPQQRERPKYIRFNNAMFAAAQGAADFAKRYSPSPLDMHIDQRQPTVEL